MTKNIICTKVLAGLSSPYPPTYPTIKGSIESEQGETDAIIPPIKEAINIT